MSRKRITIYDLAKELGISASYISRALNNHPSISQKVIDKVKQKAQELNYKHNTQAARLRQGSSNTIGVIVPHINHSFFSGVIAGIEEVCFEHHHSLIICQSQESFARECKAIDTLIHQNVDCIIISVSAETASATHLQNIRKHNIELIQFDRYIDGADSVRIVNDNEQAAFKATEILIKAGYRKIAFLGGPEYLDTFRKRKEGYLGAMQKYNLEVPGHYIVDDVLYEQKATEAAGALLSLPDPPDAFMTVSDHQSLGVWRVAETLHIPVPEKLGIFGFANEEFSSIIHPSLSSVNQRNEDMGRKAAGIYFEELQHEQNTGHSSAEYLIESLILERESSKKNGKRS